MDEPGADAIIAGHVCLDIIPVLSGKNVELDSLLVPGKLLDVGPAIITTGGAVSNTGLALHRLGSRVKLMGKIGDDPFGETILNLLRRHEPSLADGMIVAKGEYSSYTIVISPPQVDRIFLHCTGANDNFTAADLNVVQLERARLFHFGYPPLMRSMFEQQGEQLALLLQTAKSKGLTVSLDLARPDPESFAGKADWRTILQAALPYVDVFLPSFEESVYMLHRDRYEQWLQESPSGELLPYATGQLMSALSEELLAMGVAVVALKLGEYGLYVRTTSNPERLAAMGRCRPPSEMQPSWKNRELLSTCYEVNVVGTTGAGDCAIAGYLSGMLQGLSLEETLQLAVGVGACNVEQADATSGVPSLEEVRRRIAGGWKKRKLALTLPGWTQLENGLWSSGTSSCSWQKEVTHS